MTYGKTLLKKSFDRPFMCEIPDRVEQRRAERGRRQFFRLLPGVLVEIRRLEGAQPEVVRAI